MSVMGGGKRKPPAVSVHSGRNVTWQELARMQPTGVSASARATLQSDLDQRCERDAQLEQLA